jgi:hypothetical protein
MRKLGFLGWAFSGGVFFGQVPGANLGGIGAALIGAGAIPAFRGMEAGNPNAPMLFVGCLALGSGLLAGGYSQYCSAFDSSLSVQFANRAASADPAIREAWAATWRAWSAGRYSSGARTEAGTASADAFIDGYAIKYGRLVAAVTKQRPFDADEFIVAVGQHDSFVLTNMTLYLFASDNPIPNPALVIPLREIEEYRFETRGSGCAKIRLRSGKTMDVPTSSGPKAEVLNRFSKAARAITSAGDDGGARRFCIDCGAPHEPDENFCSECGKATKRSATS